MSVFTSLILGIIQGFTEFLPISSSGHLVLAQRFIPGFSQPGILFDTVLHAGTLVAVIVYFWKTILKLRPKMITLLIVGTIPAVLAGFFLDDWFEAMFAGASLLGIQFIISGVMNYMVDIAKPKKEKISIFDSILIGIAQAISITPAISRSSATIFAATSLGINRKEAAEFSFLLSIPAILGAIVLQTAKYGFTTDISYSYYLVGFVASFIFGIISIKALLSLLLTKHFKIFAYYCFILGGLLIIFV